MINHSPPSSHSTFSRQLPFPFNVASRIWRRLWHGLLLSCQKSSPSRGTRIPLTPSPTQSNEETRGSSPSCRPVPYDRVSSLMDVDYFRGNINQDGISQDGYLDALRVVNPDMRTQRSSTDSYYDMFDDRVGRRSSHVPCLPDLWFTRVPTPSLSVSIGLGLQKIGESMMAGSQESMHAEACPAPATESMPEELSTPSSRNERPLPARPHALPPNAFSRAMEFFMPSQPSPSLSEADIIQDDFNLEDDDSDIDSAAPSLGSRLLLTDSNLGSSLSLAQYRDQWARNCQLAQPDPRPVTPDVLEPEVTIPSHQHQPHTVSASGNSDVAQRSRGQAHRVSSNWSYSSSPSRSIMPESFHRQQRGIFERLCNLPLLALTLATGTVAQKRRHA